MKKIQTSRAFKISIFLAVVTAMAVSVSNNRVLASTSSSDMLELSEQSGEAFNYVENATVYSGGTKPENLYVSTAETLIHFNRSIDGTDLVAEVWDGTDWETEVVVVADSIASDYNFSAGNIFVLEDDTVVWLYDDLIVTYSDAGGFAHYTNPATTGTAVSMPTGVVFIDCFETDDGTGNQVGQIRVRTWQPGAEVSAEKTLDSCNDQDALAWSASNDTLVDFVHGIAYDMANDYAVIDEIEGSTSLGQDDTEYYVAARNMGGNQVLATETALLSYDYDSHWAEPVIFTDEFVRQVYTTENQEEIIALVSNTDYTTYTLYAWSSTDGWVRIEQYDFDSATTILTPTTSKVTDELYYAFWENDTNTLSVNSFATVHAIGTVTVLTERTLLCNANCTFALDVSAKGKVFLTWKKSSALYASVWTPDEDVWEDKLLVKNGVSSQINESQVGDGGDWFVNYQARKHVQFIMRWTPDGGWNKKQLVVSQQEFFDGTSYYLTYLNTYNDTLNVRKLKSSGKEMIETITDTYKFNPSNSFLFSDWLFLSTTTTDNEALLTAVQL